MNYSIAYRNSAGQTERSEFTAFDTDTDAIAQGNRGLRDSTIVEVWKGDHLLARLFQNEPGEASQPLRG